MPEDFVPHTAETFKDLALPEEHSAKFLELANEHKISADAAKPFGEFAKSLVPAPVEFNAHEVDVVKSFYPDGTEFDDETLKGLIEFANENKLPKEALEKITKLDQGYQERALKRAETAWEATQNEWKAELEKDSEMTAGDGYAKNLSHISAVLQDYGGEKGEDGFNDMQRMLNMTGTGNHPAMARFLLKVAQALPGEGRPTKSGPGTGATSIAEQLFPKKE